MTGHQAVAGMGAKTPRLLDYGEMAPSFNATALNGNPDYAFDSAAGRPIVMLFLGSGRWGPAAAALDLLARHAGMFNDSEARFFGVTVDPDDVAEGRIAQRIPGIRWFLDYDARVSRLFGAADGERDHARYLGHWLLLDRTLRVIQCQPINQGDRIFAALARLIGQGDVESSAPILTVPRIFEPDLCRQLVALYDQHGGTDSGFMREEGGLTVPKLDYSFKRRSDYTITDTAMQVLLLDRLRRRLIPQIAKALQFQPTRIERWIVACYDSQLGGFFRPHRDNTTSGTAHRKFACTINLNADEYDGGELRFPEFGDRTYRAPTGGAVIFSCALLHEATPVTRGRRYAFLPFFYDEAGARLRERNQPLLAKEPSLDRPDPREGDGAECA
jgi:predicted 2-oxoglutarate/Fe(II)-dependent dioxygenase YbiX